MQWPSQSSFHQRAIKYFKCTHKQRCHMLLESPFCTIWLHRCKTNCLVPANPLYLGNWFSPLLLQSHNLRILFQIWDNFFKYLSDTCTIPLSLSSLLLHFDPFKLIHPVFPLNILFYSSNPQPCTSCVLRHSGSCKQQLWSTVFWKQREQKLLRRRFKMGQDNLCSR